STFQGDFVQCSNTLLVAQQASRPYQIIPYCRNSKFSGREDLIESLRRFSESNGHNRIALHGLGGSGKTQIALEYLYRHASESDCDVFWVHGSGLPKFSEDFRAIAQHVRIPPASGEPDEEGFLLNIKRWFEGPASGDWMLVIDNADNEEDFMGNSGRISKFVPQGSRGTLILTTRSAQVALRERCERIEVGKMPVDEAQELFLKLLGDFDSSRDEEKVAITTILKSIHHIPLAITGAAAFMTETQTPPSTYWNIFRGSDDHAKRLLSRPFCDIQRETDVTESTLTMYFITFDRITRGMPLAADLLRLIAFFDRENIPEELLSQSGLEGIDDQIQFREAIGKLLGFSLVTAIAQEDKTFYELHRLVQLSLQVYLPAEELSRWKAIALGVVSKLFPRRWTTWRDLGPTYIPHALAVTKGFTDPIAEALCFHLGRYLQRMGSYNNAESQLRRCIALREEYKEHDWDEEGPRRVICLGSISINQGKSNMAEDMLRRLLADIGKSLNPNHPIVQDAIQHLAWALSSQGKYDESEKMHRHALEGHEKILGPDHKNTLQSVNNVAAVLQCRGKYDESERMHRRALEGAAKIHGPDHPNTLTGVSNLARVLVSQGKYDESEKMHRRALEGHEKILGPDHPDTLTNHPNTLTSVNNLADVLQSQGKYDESERMHRRALEGHEKICGPEHPDTLSSVNNLALVLQDQGMYDESEKIHRRALEGYKKILGPDHPITLASVKILA
ncbi:unnamed protein product, partial [Tuber aestivum]